MRQVLGVFAKEPRPGTVKSRLAAAIGPESAARLYEAFLLDFLDRLEPLDFHKVLAYWPPTARTYFEQIARGRYAIEPQCDGDLGARMEFFFARQFQNGATHAVLVGSDSPDMPLSSIEQAFVLLNGHDVVLGPTEDGGYYLLGMKMLMPAIFNGMEWSGSHVFQETRQRLDRLGVRPAALETWYDVDREEDLRRLWLYVQQARLSRSDHHSLPRTWEVLESLQI